MITPSSNYYYNSDIKVTKIYNTLVQESSFVTGSVQESSFVTGSVKNKAAEADLLKQISQNFVLKGRALLTTKKFLPSSKNVRYSKEDSTYYALSTGYVSYGSVEDLKIQVLPFLIITKDKLSVYALVPKATVSEEDISLNEAWFRSLWKQYKLKAEVSEDIFDELSELYHETGGLIKIASGIPAKRGFNKRMQPHGANLRRGFDNVNFLGLTYEEIKCFRKTAKNSVIGDFLPSLQAHVGSDVMGKEIHPGMPKSSNIGKFLKVLDNTNVVSEIDGILRVGTGSLFYMSRPHYVEGDIHTALEVPDGCDLVVTGSVVNCSSLKCSGTVTVYGNVENSKIYSEGDLLVAGGIVRKSYVEVNASVEAQFADHSILLANGSLKVRKYITFCQATVSENIFILDKTKGKVSSSTLSLCSYLIVSEVGSQTGSSTKIEIIKKSALENSAMKVSMLKNEKQNLIKIIAKFQKALGTNFEKNPHEYIKNIPQARQEKTFLAIKYLKKVHEQLSSINQKISTLENSLQEKKLSSNGLKQKIFVLKRLFGGVNMIINGSSSISEYSVNAPTKIVYDPSKGNLTKNTFDPLQDHDLVDLGY